MRYGSGRFAPVVLASLGAVTFAGCGSIAFKAGGTGGEQQAARDHCRAAGRGESPDFERCMKEQGWSVRQLGDSRATASEAAGAAEASPSAQLPAVPRDAVDPGTQTPNAPVGDTPRPAEAPAAPAAALEPVEAPPVRTPIVVNGWFKFGGNADALESAKRRCAGKLGASDAPAGDANTLSPEMFDCLREEGWRAVP